MKPSPVYGERALFFGEEKAVIIADLHIGIEMEYRMQGVNIAPQTDALLQRCIEIVEEMEAETLVIAGDIKHIIAGEKRERAEERREVSRFLKEISNHVDVEIIKGNHDGYLRSRYARIHSSGIVMDDVAVIHGHSWPSPDMMDVEMIVMGHIHPHVRISTSIGYSYVQPCWVRGSFVRKKFREKYPRGNEDMEFVIMPAFNPLCGGVAVNREEVEGALMGLLDMGNASVYTLDGVDLGRVRNLRGESITG